MGSYQSNSCIHRWMLGEPNMQTVHGVCRRCGAQRSYPSGLEFTEAVTEFEELDRSRPIRPMAVVSLGEYANV